MHHMLPSVKTDVFTLAFLSTVDLEESKGGGGKVERLHGRSRQFSHFLSLSPAHTLTLLSCGSVGVELVT